MAFNMFRLIKPSLLTRSNCVARIGRRVFSSTKLASLNQFSDEEQMIRDTVRKFAEEIVKPRVSAMDKAAKMDEDVIRGLFDNGFMAVELEEQFGGTGASFTSAIIVIEELAKVDPAVSVMCDVQNTLVMTGMRKWCSEQQKQEWLPRLGKETLGSFCLSEAGSGSDAFAMKSRAVDKGDHWLLNGTKLWITNAAEAGVFLVFANAEPEKGYKGISCFLVPRDTKGVEVGPKEDKVGIRASSTCPIHFTDVKIPKENLVGEYGRGYKYSIEILNEGRIGIGAQMLGLAEGALQNTLPYLFDRKQFNQPIASFQGVQFQFAKLAMDIEAARVLIYNAARMKENGLDFVKEASFAKLFASNVAIDVSTECMKLCGGVSMVKEYPQEKFYRDAPIGSIYEGTSNIQLQTIAKLIARDYS